MEQTTVETAPASVHLLRHGAVADALTALRQRETSTVEFRARARSIARALAYEATRDLPLEPVDIRTPVAATTGYRIAGRIIAAPILRAGLGLLDGFLEVVPTAATGFVGLKRNEETLQPYEYYRNIPDPTGSHFFLLDPMLATGGSVLAALRALPVEQMASVHLLSIIAAPEGLAAVAAEFPTLRIFTAGIDERLDERGFIVPGLGDAGDRLCETL
jgi:uracil phosphoribosyltransferase